LDLFYDLICLKCSFLTFSLVAGDWISTDFVKLIGLAVVLELLGLLDSRVFRSLVISGDVNDEEQNEDEDEDDEDEDDDRDRFRLCLRR
jgi:hypothetical protein